MGKYRRLSTNIMCMHLEYPSGHTTLLRRRINVNDVDSTTQQRHVPSCVITDQCLNIEAV